MNSCTMTSLEMVQVDVFTQEPLEGNPLAVFPDARGVSGAQMQAIAREMNLSETTFVLPLERPDSDARVRIFTPFEELPFAGHPTIGTAHVLSKRRESAGRIRLHENAGVIDVERELDDRLFMTAPRPAVEATFENRAEVARALGLREVDLLEGVPVQAAGAGGVAFLYVALRDERTVDDAVFDAAGMLGAVGDYAREVFVYAPSGENRVYSRMFAPLIGITEDPATGGASAPLITLLHANGLLPGGNAATAVSEQGTKMGRRSFVHMRLHADGRVQVGGHVAEIMTGRLTLPDS